MNVVVEAKNPDAMIRVIQVLLAVPLDLRRVFERLAEAVSRYLPGKRKDRTPSLMLRTAVEALHDSRVTVSDPTRLSVAWGEEAVLGLTYLETCRMWALCACLNRTTAKADVEATLRLLKQLSDAAIEQVTVNLTWDCSPVRAYFGKAKSLRGSVEYVHGVLLGLAATFLTLVHIPLPTTCKTKTSPRAIRLSHLTGGPIIDLLRRNNLQNSAKQRHARLKPCGPKRAVSLP